jgi:hypothetical protein
MELPRFHSILPWYRTSFVAMRKILPMWQALGIVKYLVAGSRSLFKVSIYDIDELFCGFCLL